MKPFGGPNLTFDEKVYNYRLSRARRIVENVFGILVSRFRLFERPIPPPPNSVDKIVLAACVLDNFLRDHSPQTYIPRASVDTEDFNIGALEERESLAWLKLVPTSNQAKQKKRGWLTNTTL